MSLTVQLLWEKGEGHFKNGDIIESILSYQRAKQLFTAENNGTASAPRASGSAQKNLGDILQKILLRIDTALLQLQENPVATLGLLRGFDKSDVKKAYRRCALKYHPDKNLDCDSSCVFTAIQAAYEELLITAPIDSQTDSIYPIYASTFTTAFNVKSAASASAAQKCKRFKFHHCLSYIFACTAMLQLSHIQLYITYLRSFQISSDYSNS